jgi:hypothetical protein
MPSFLADIDFELDMAISNAFCACSTLTLDMTLMNNGDCAEENEGVKQQGRVNVSSKSGRSMDERTNLFISIKFDACTSKR